MAKYIIDLPEKMSMYLNVWKCEDGDCVLDKTYTTSDLRPYIASESYIDGLSKGKKEVWEFVNTVNGLSDEELYEIFPNGCPYEMTYQEAKTKYEAWRKQRDKICVGDEVKYFGDNYVVVYVGADEVYHLVDGNWIREVVQGKYKLTKTGRHFDEVAELLKKMEKES